MLTYFMEQWGGKDGIAVSEDTVSNRMRHGRSPVTVRLDPVGKKDDDGKEVVLDSYDPEQLHCHRDFVEIFFVHRGHGVAFLDGTRFIIQKGDVVCIQPGQIHANYSLAGLTVYNCLISEALLAGGRISARYLEEDGRLGLEPLLHLDGTRILEVEDIFRKLFGEFLEKTLYYEEAMLNEVNLLLLCLARFQRLDRQQVKTREAMSPLLEYISSNYKTATLQELAEMSSYHPDYLSRLFHQTQGLTFTEYVNRLRMNEAVQLLTQTDQSVEEIAAAVGFSSRVHFYDVFKKQTGMTPGELRRRAVTP